MEMEIRYIEKTKLLFLLLIPILIWFIDYNANEEVFSFCLFKNLFGIRCFGCGFLRGISALLHLKIGKIIELNLLNFFTIPIVILIYIKTLLKLRSQIFNKINI